MALWTKPVCEGCDLEYCFEGKCHLKNDPPAIKRWHMLNAGMEFEKTKEEFLKAMEEIRRTFTK